MSTTSWTIFPRAYTSAGYFAKLFEQAKTGILAVTNDVAARKASRVTGGTCVLGGGLDVTTIGKPTKAYSPISLAVAMKGHFAALRFHGTSYRITYISSAVTLRPTTQTT